MSAESSFWPLEYLRGIFGRIVLWRRVESLDRMLARAQKIFASLKATVKALQDTNQELGSEVTRLENENKQLTDMVLHLQREQQKVDPNAMCPNCGHRDGHLTHVVKDGSVRPVNNCHKCGFTFISSLPIAGAEAAAKAYQAPQEKL
jgi:transcription elongation factor Elf1